MPTNPYHAVYQRALDVRLAYLRWEKMTGPAERRNQWLRLHDHLKALCVEVDGVIRSHRQ